MMDWAGRVAHNEAANNAYKSIVGKPETCTRNVSCPCALTEHHAMKACWGSGGVTPRILDLGIRWR
jgi:hypothetical protein